MNEYKQLRPRLTSREVRFLVDSLKRTLDVCEVKEREFKELEREVYRLRKEIQYNTMVWKQLKEAKEKLKQMGNFGLTRLHYRTVCDSLIRRFESLLNGGKKHTGLWAEHSLQQIYLEPKNLEKSQSV